MIAQFVVVAVALVWDCEEVFVKKTQILAEGNGLF
jgi:hypothetical protein